jgi:Cu+-exporting ATPase
MEKVNWKIEGMSCTNCALTVDKFLQEQRHAAGESEFYGWRCEF